MMMAATDRRIVRIYSLSRRQAEVARLRLRLLQLSRQAEHVREVSSALSTIMDERSSISCRS